MTYPQMRIWIPSLRFGSGLVARYTCGSGYESFVRPTECRSVISWKNLIKQRKFVMGRPCGSLSELARCSTDERENLCASPGCHTLWHYMGSIRFWNIRTYVTHPFTRFTVSFVCACICIFTNRIHVVRWKMQSITLDASLHDRVDHCMRNIWISTPIQHDSTCKLGRRFYYYYFLL